MPGKRNTLDEFKQGTLHSGSKTGPIVKDRKQAIAIALDQARRRGEDVPDKPLRPKKRPKTIGGALGDMLNGRR